MRYGVLSDVHGNLQALEAVVAALARMGVDRYICAGDLVGYGAQPNECVEAVALLEPVCVAGNHDLMALGELSEENCIRLARRSMRWTRKVLSEDARAYLAALPRRAETDGVVVAHGSLDDPEEYVLTADQAALQLKRLSSPGVLVLGHTHLPIGSDGLRMAPEAAAGGSLNLRGAAAWVLNPGAVGQSREPLARARFMLLDVQRAEVSFHAISYDLEGARHLLRREGLPSGSYHLRPTRAKAIWWRTRRLLSPLRAMLRRSDR